MEKDKKQAQVFHFDLYGKRTEKYDFLLNNNLQNVQWQELKFEDENYFFVPKDFSLNDEYEKGFKIDELFTVNTSGVASGKDAELVSFSPFAQNNNLYDYRPFDVRFIDYDKNKIQRNRYQIMRHFLKGENVGLVVSKINRQLSTGYIFITSKIVDRHILDSAHDSTFACPLYLYPESDKIFENAKRKSNLNESIINEISQRISLQFTEEKGEAENTFAPIDVLDYIYAILHSPAYRERYKEFLKIDFPRVPYPENVEQFWTLALLGGKLRRLHLLEGVEPQQGMTDYPIAGSNEVTKPYFLCHCGLDPQSYDNRVYINDSQFFENVPLVAWNFYIGGYQPAQKWLKDRKGRTLNYDDIEHYRKIIFVLKETGAVMREIDENLIK